MSQRDLHNPLRPSRRCLPAGICALGFVSLLMDVSSEVIHGLLPVYLVVGLGATALTLRAYRRNFVARPSECSTS